MLVILLTIKIMHPNHRAIPCTTPLPRPPPPSPLSVEVLVDHVSAEMYLGSVYYWQTTTNKASDLFVSIPHWYSGSC